MKLLTTRKCSLFLFLIFRFCYRLSRAKSRVRAIHVTVIDGIVDTKALAAAIAVALPPGMPEVFLKRYEASAELVKNLDGQNFTNFHRQVQPWKS